MLISTGPLPAVPQVLSPPVSIRTSSSRFMFSRPMLHRALQFGSISHHLYICGYPQWGQIDEACHRSPHHHIVPVLVVTRADDVGIGYFGSVDR